MVVLAQDALGGADRVDREQADPVGGDDRVEHQPAHVVAGGRARSAARRTCRRRCRRARACAPRAHAGARRGPRRCRRSVKNRRWSPIASAQRFTAAAGGGVRSEAPIAPAAPGTAARPCPSRAGRSRPAAAWPPRARTNRAPAQEREPGLTGSAAQHHQHRRIARPGHGDPKIELLLRPARPVERHPQRRARGVRHVGTRLRPPQPRPGPVSARGGAAVASPRSRSGPACSRAAARPTHHTRRARQPPRRRPSGASALT